MGFKSQKICDRKKSYRLSSICFLASPHSLLSYGLDQWPQVTIGKLFSTSRQETNMKTWKAPKVREIAVGMEINCYACAKL